MSPQTPNGSPKPPGDGYLVEAARPLSESMLWDVQGEYYQPQAIHAWASGEVPHVLTTGRCSPGPVPRLIAAFAIDCAAGRFGTCDPAEPLYVVELGAGTGRLGFEILLALGRERPTPFRIVYVLTDAVEANVEFWKDHPKLAVPLAAGVLDVARFAVGRDEAILLDGSGVRLEKNSVTNPIVVVSNYLFDVVPQDAFEDVDGTLYEEEVALYARVPGVDAGTPDFFREVFVAPYPVPARENRYEPEIDALLREVATEEASDRRFLFPAVGVRALRALAAFAGGRLLHLIGERPGGLPERRPDREAVTAGIEADPEIPSGPAAIKAAEAEAIRPGALLAMGVHGGSISLPVEVPILARSLARYGAELLRPPALPTGLFVGAIVAGATDDPVEVRSSFAHVVGDLGPEDVYFTVKSAVEHRVDLALPVLLAALRTGGYDPYLFRQIFDALEEGMKGIDPTRAAELERVLRTVFDHDFPLDDTIELAYPIGVLLAAAERYRAALEFFERSVARSGPRAATAFNIALCHLHLEDPEAALAALGEATSIDPGYAPAQELAATVREERGRRGTTGERSVETVRHAPAPSPGPAT